MRGDEKKASRGTPKKSLLSALHWSLRKVGRVGQEQRTRACALASNWSADSSVCVRRRQIDQTADFSLPRCFERMCGLIPAELLVVKLIGPSQLIVGAKPPTLSH